ncbi:hypothetical protein PR048_017603 [Dryococelus australis]|uniref:Uncharacterized protein n=1 Tax=Dryococelus australis TaxID=614101 RepID=A0ABQ9H9Z0_9NEOP|nr:hypothetical protein PR048_017603 [Dryococelus australis]
MRDPRENLPTNAIVRHDSHLQKSATVGYTGGADLKHVATHMCKGFRRYELILRVKWCGIHHRFYVALQPEVRWCDIRWSLWTCYGVSPTYAPVWEVHVEVPANRNGEMRRASQEPGSVHVGECRNAAATFPFTAAVSPGRATLQLAPPVAGPTRPFTPTLSPELGHAVGTRASLPPSVHLPALHFAPHAMALCRTRTAREAMSKRGSARGDRDMHINSLIASTRKALNWCAVFPSITRLYEIFSGDYHFMTNAGIKVSGKREIPEKTRRPAASSGTILTCENAGVTWPGINIQVVAKLHANTSGEHSSHLEDEKILSSALKEVFKMPSISTNICINPPFHGHPDSFMNHWKIPDCFSNRHNTVTEGGYIILWGCIPAFKCPN